MQAIHRHQPRTGRDAGGSPEFEQSRSTVAERHHQGGASFIVTALVVDDHAPVRRLDPRSSHQVVPEILELASLNAQPLWSAILTAASGSGASERHLLLWSLSGGMSSGHRAS